MLQQDLFGLEYEQLSRANLFEIAFHIITKQSSLTKVIC